MYKIKGDITPILKWAGGKRKLIPEIKKRIPENYNTYFEPFVGGGSVFLTLQPDKCCVNDFNSELINVYSVVKNNLTELIEILKVHKEKHSKEYYYQIRTLDRTGDIEQMNAIERAARIIYLNHTCYNGLYRVNSKGQYNTPMGKYVNPKILDENNLIKANKYFNEHNVIFLNGDYYETFAYMKENDFVYLDPPYDPITASSAFTMYTELGFNKDDQIKLKEFCDKLTEKNIKFLQSNSDTKFIRELYKDYKIEIVQMPRMINSKGDKRQNINEVLISNY